MFYIVTILTNINEINKKLWFIVFFGEAVVTCTIVYFLSRWKLAYMDFSMLHSVITRCAGVYLVSRLIGAKTPGFDTVDIKMLQDAIFLSTFPIFLISTTNWKI
jgi:hypothetical protein